MRRLVVTIQAGASAAAFLERTKLLLNRFLSSPRRPPSLRDATGASLLIVSLGILAGCAKPPQLGGDERVLTAADALLTAVSSRDTKLLDQCEANINAMRQAGELSEPAHEYLTRIVAEARGGNWKSARERLVGLVRAQRGPG